MPRGDRTGPAGAGPKTGRVAGYCSGYGVPGYMNPGMGMGWGRGMGRGLRMGMGRGWGSGYGFLNCPFCGWAQPNWPQPLTTKDQKQFLNDYKKDLVQEIKDVDKSLSDLSEDK
jgi:hypothetical protein